MKSTLTLLLALLGTAACAGPAPMLQTASPAPDSLLEDPPLQVELVFNTAMKLDSAEVMIMHRDTTAFLALTPELAEGGKRLLAPLTRKMLGGHYLLRWRAMAKDGTVLRGMHAFKVDVPE